MAGPEPHDAAASGGRDLLRSVVPAVAVVAVVFAALTDPAGWREVLFLVVAAGAFVVWAAWPRFPTLVFAAAVLVPVVLAKQSGHLDGGLFLVSLLAIAVAGWERSPWRVAVAGGAAVATPVLVVALNPGDIDPGTWVVAVVFPGIMSWLFRRQEDLSRALEASRQELARRAAADERRRVARDVHDLVGHGLAAVLLHIAGARHVLRRDVDAADEALRTAEDAGRRSLAELRRTVALLRSESEDALAVVPGLGQLGDLVDDARAQGLDVEYRVSGAEDAVDAIVGLALYRIAQEALLNAARHAPQARTVVSAQVRDGRAELLVESLGATGQGIGAADPSRPGYGLVGMRERAAGVGGVLEVGPTPLGFPVRGPVPNAAGPLAPPAEVPTP